MKAAQSIEQQLARTARVGAALAWPVVYAMALAYSAWSWRHREMIPTLVKNKLSWEFRTQMAWWVGGSLGGLLFVYLVAIVADWIQSRRYAPLRMIGELNRRLAGVLGIPFAATLLPEGIESSDPIWTALTAVVAAAPVAVSAYFWRSPPRLDDEREPGAKRSLPSRLGAALGPLTAGAAVLALWAAYGYLLSRFSIANHHALNTRTIDLGYYDNVFYNSLHGRPLGCSFTKGGNHSSAHFDPILVLLSPLYLLYPHAELLLVLQSVWLGMGVVPAYLLGARALDSRAAGLTMAFAYAVYPALHGANLYEFHSLTLIAPLVLWLFYFLEKRQWLGYAPMVLLLCLCREDVPLLLFFVGLYAIVSGRGTARAGALTIAFSVFYYILVRTAFMPSKDLLNSGSENAYSYAYYFSELNPASKGVGDIVLSLVTNPMFVVKLAFGDTQKILYLLVLFVPLGLLPLVARRARLTLLYGLAVCLLASRKPVYEIGFQYAAMIFPFAFAITPRGIRELMEDARVQGFGLDAAGVRRGALAFVAAASIVVSWKFGVLLENTAFRGGFGRVARWPLSEAQQKEYAELKVLLDLIEPGAGVLTTNRVGPHVSNRKEVYLLSQGKLTNYILADEREVTGKQREWVDTALRKGNLAEVKRSGQFVLWGVVR